MAGFDGGGRGGRAAAASGYSNIAEAAEAQQQDVVLELLDAGHDVNALDKDGNTALHWACWFRWDTIASRLLYKGARMDIGNKSHETAVHWAAKASNVLALDAMTKHDRGTLSQRDVDGFTPFIICAQNDNAPVMEWMYLKGASVEEQDDCGRTALQWACYKGHRRTVQWLLSRHASIAHRDHEGMTAVHWVALKGHDHVADMLMDVGGVHLLHIQDAAGDTPIALAVRKQNRYLVLSFHKAQLFQRLFKRPYISRNYFANLFVLFVAFNIIVFAFFMGPGIANQHPLSVIMWSAIMGFTLLLWTQNCSADPGWMAAKTISTQASLIGEHPETGFDASQPVESQMAFQNNRVLEAMARKGGDASSLEAGQAAARLAHLESEQAKYNYQRHLITEARRTLSDGGGGGLCGPAVPPYLSGGSAELQPLINPADLQALPPSLRKAQLDRASATLREREQATSASVGKARVEDLMARSRGEYVSLVERGEFKQVCVICRVRREMRSHHCKECGRCVSRLDHHCPWIDNCVGIGNQRSFYLFVMALFSTIIIFYVEVLLYTVDAAFPLWTNGGLNLSKLEPVVVLIAVGFNVVWLAFVGALVVRHSGYMCVNITTYEVLIRPAHVQRRFPKARGRLWFLADLTFGSCLRHVADYWTLNMSNDTADFMGPLLQEAQRSTEFPPVASRKHHRQQ